MTKDVGEVRFCGFCGGEVIVVMPRDVPNPENHALVVCLDGECRWIVGVPDVAARLDPEVHATTNSPEGFALPADLPPAELLLVPPDYPGDLSS